MSIADLVALSAVDLAGGFGFALHQASVGRELLNGFETLDIADFVENG